MSNYTGPVTLTTFENFNGDRFVHVSHDLVDDEAAKAKVYIAYRDEGYKPTKVREHYMVNGSLVLPGERDWRPAIGFRPRSAHLRA